MKSRTLLFAAIAAAALAAASCGGKEEPSSNPSTSGGSSQKQQIYGEPFTCAGRDNKSVAFLSPNPQNPAQTVTFDLSSFVAPGFPTTYAITENVAGQMRTTSGGSPDKATIFCESVTSLEDYVIALGGGSYDFGRTGPSLNADRVFGDFPDSVAYVFKKSASSQSGLEFVGAAPNFGNHEKFLVLKNYWNAGDLLIAAQEAKWTRFDSGIIGGGYYSENTPMLNAMAQALSFKNFNDGSETRKRVVWVNGVAIDEDKAMSPQELLRKAMALSKTGFDMNSEIRFEETTEPFKLSDSIIKIVIYRLPGQAAPYNPSAKPPASILEKMAAVPLVLGNNPSLEQMELVMQGGEPYLRLAARFKGKGIVRSYTGGRLSDILGGAVPGEVTVSTEEFHHLGPQLVPIKEILEQGLAWTKPLLK